VGTHAREAGAEFHCAGAWEAARSPQQKEALCQVGKKPHPSTLNSWRSDLKSLVTSVGGTKLHVLNIEAVIRCVEPLQATPIPEGRRSGVQRLRDRSIRNKVGLLSQILRSAKARHIIPLNAVQDLDRKELLGEEERLHRRHRALPVTPRAARPSVGGGARQLHPEGGTSTHGALLPLLRAGGADRLAAGGIDRLGVVRRGPEKYYIKLER
jgi:hypothetical protein